MIDPTDARRIVRDVARAAGVDPDAVLGRDRTATIVAVRRRAIVELHDRGCSWAEIGRVLERRRNTIREIGSGWRRGRSVKRCDPPGPGSTLDACRRST